MRLFSALLTLVLLLPLSAGAEDAAPGFFARSDTAAFRAMLHRIPALMVTPGMARA